MSRYADSHKITSGPGDTRPTALQIIQDENLVGNMTDKVFLVTGCSSGIGIETGRALAATGAKIFLAVRNLEKGESACKSFLEPGRVELLKLDIASLATVRTAASTFLSKSSTLNGLICNAGVMLNPTRELTTEGFEIQLATNYLGHFLLFYLLKDSMLKASTPEFSSRLVNVSSAGHHSSEIIFDDFNLAKDGAYDGSKAYGQSKLAQIYMANYVDRIFGQRGIHALSLMPGGIFTNLQRHVPKERMDAYKKNPTSMTFMKSAEQGAATTVFAAVSKDWEGKGGKYLEDCAVAKEQPLTPGIRGVKAYAYDEEKENRTWMLTLETLGLKRD